MYSIDGQIINISYKKIQVNNNYILPTITLIFSRSSKSDLNAKSTDLIIKSPLLKLFVKRNQSYINIATVSATNQLYIWNRNGESEIEFHLSLNDYLLSEIETIRNGNNLNLHAIIYVLSSPKDKSYLMEELECLFDITFSIPKSEWNEEIFPELTRKKAILISIPTIDLMIQI